MKAKLVGAERRWSDPVTGGHVSAWFELDADVRTASGGTTRRVYMDFASGGAVMPAETMAFASDADGRVTDWGELAVSHANTSGRGFRECLERLAERMDE